MQTIILNNKPKLVSCASIAGKKENDGNVSEYFDAIVLDGRYGKKSWEEAESRMQKDAAFMVLHKTQKKPENIDFIFGGDLLNQCMGTSFGATQLDIPFFGIYGACSTFCEGLILSSVFVDGGYGKNVMCTSSSHFCTSERQFRFPLEYGGQRAPAAQWTVTAAGAALVSDEGSEIEITAVTPGKVIDAGISDAANMGAAMAPVSVKLTPYGDVLNLYNFHTVKENVLFLPVFYPMYLILMPFFVASNSAIPLSVSNVLPFIFHFPFLRPTR